MYLEVYMGIDLFENEQKISAAAALLIQKVHDGARLNLDDYEALAGEYDKLLDELRRTMHLADRTAAILYESNMDLADKVHHDALTGIFNRRYMEASLIRVISSLTRSGGGELSVLMMDLDFFKNYNDTYGHNMGDACLKAVAKALAVSVLRPEDFVARYGGEEFIAILPNTGENGAYEVAERIFQNVRLLNIPHEKSEAASSVTISIGITTGSVLNTKDGSDFIKRADEALYISKQSGRNRSSYLAFEKE
jgi:diguanylate cyclase (GGDEF)-like protein